MCNKKVLFFIGDITSKGGIERVTSTLSNSLAKYYYTQIISLYASNEKIVFDVKNTNVTFLKNKPETSMFNRPYNNFIGLFFDLYYLAVKFFPIRNKIKETDADIIISSDIKMSLLLFISSLGLDKKIIAIEHFEYNVPGFILRCLRKLLYKKLYKIVKLTNEDDLYYDWLPEGKVQIIPNIVKINKEKEKEKEKENIIIGVGRLTEQKGFDLLIDAWSLIEPKHKEWVVNIYGDGEDYDNLKNKIEEKKLKNINIFPFNDNIDAIYSQASLFVLSSRFEGLGMVLLEALAHGVPCVSFDCPAGPKTIITDRYNGLLVESGNIFELSSKISEIIVDEKLRTDISSVAKESIFKYSEDEVINKWRKVLNFE